MTDSSTSSFDLCIIFILTDPSDKDLAGLKPTWPAFLTLMQDPNLLKKQLMDVVQKIQECKVPAKNFRDTNAKIAEFSLNTGIYLYL